MAEIFWGFLFDREKEKQLLQDSKWGVPNAVNQYQTGFLSGLQQKMPILSVLAVGTFPKNNRRLFFHADRFESDLGTVFYLPYINFYFLKDLCVMRQLKRKTLDLLQKNDRVTLYVYSLYMPFLKVAKQLKKRFGDRLDICLIITDLPGRYGVLRRWYTPGGMRERFEADRKMAAATVADRYVFVAEPMRELFPEKPSVVVEGFLPETPFDHSQNRVPKSILYTGSLNEKYGIGTLLQAFSQIEDEEFQLWICGAGGMEDAVKAAAKKDSRIHFFGFLEKRKITELQTACDVLVNPRPATDAFTKYSFPSKTMEYLLSGSKVVMHRLAGIGEEYYQFIRVIPEHSAESIRQTLLAAAADTEFYRSAWQTQVEWMRAQKNAAAQVQKLKEIQSKSSQNRV